MDPFISDISAKVLSQNGVIALLFTTSFLLFVWRGVPSLIKRDDKYINLLIEKFSSEMGLSRIAYEQNMSHIIEIFAKGLENIREDGRNHKDGLKELRSNQVIIEQKVDRNQVSVDQKIDKLIYVLESKK